MSEKVDLNRPEAGTFRSDPAWERVINIFRYAPNGQLAEEWVQYDPSAFLAQLR